MGAGTHPPMAGKSTACRGPVLPEGGGSGPPGVGPEGEPKSVSVKNVTCTKEVQMEDSLW